MPKRASHIMENIAAEENVRLAILNVNAAHHKRSVCRWVERTLDERVAELQRMVQDPGWTANPPRKFAFYDKSAGKWRDEVCEPPIWPDQYIHHMIVQALEPVLMKGMDYWCCGSIPGRGISHGMRGIKRWLREDKKGTRYAAELDIKSFYKSIQPKYVIRWLARKIKDKPVLRLIWAVIKDGIKIGYYISQWMANAMLQPLDHLIREKTEVSHYIRYIDNITIFASSKRKLHRAVKAISEWLHGVELRLKENWQVYKVDTRMVTALGYRYDHEKVLLRKRNLLRLKRQLARAYKRIDRGKPLAVSMAAGLLSRIGQLRRCDSQRLRRRLVRPGLLKILKDVVRKHSRERSKKQWNRSSRMTLGRAALTASNATPCARKRLAAPAT